MIGHDLNSNCLIKLKKKTQKSSKRNKKLAPLPHPNTNKVHYGFDIPYKELRRRILPHFKIVSH